MAYLEGGGGNRKKRGGEEEEVHYVNDELYSSLAKAAADWRARSGPGDAAAAAEAETVLAWEARLLDAREYRRWLELFTKDCIYWVPANWEGGDPRTESSINFDDRRRMTDRIALIETGVLHAQIPPSRTCRNISNIEAWPGTSGGLEVRSNLVIWEYRRGRMNSWAGRQEHYLTGGPGQWKIRWKVITLLNCDEPQGDVTFIV